MSRRSRQRGSAMLESVFGMCFLLFLCFSLVELFMMIGRQMAVDYASFYGSKALALGYAGENCRKAVRVAGIPASGRDVSDGGFRVPMSPSSDSVRQRLRQQAAHYMSLGRPSGVEYEYWYTTGSNEPRYSIGLDPYQESVVCRARLADPPFLIEAMRTLMSLAADCCGGGKAPEPTGETRMYNYSKQWMDE